MKTYCVTWNPGNFGHLVKAIIGQEMYGDGPANMGDHTHEYHHPQIDTVHEYDRAKIVRGQKTIKPSFSDQNLKYFPWYLNGLKNNFRVSVSDFVQTYWNFVEPTCDLSFNLDMTNMFNDVESFHEDIGKFLCRDRLSNDTRSLIDIKRKMNLPHLADFQDMILDAGKPVIDDPLLTAIWICHHCRADYETARSLQQRYARQ